MPVPPRGYWAKLRAGEKVKKDLLPKHKGPERIVTRRDDDAAQKPRGERPEVLGFLDEATRAAVLEVSENVTVPDELTQPHPLVSEVLKRLRSQKPDGNSPILSAGGALLSIHVTKDTLDRSLRIMDTLIKGLETLGYPTKISDGRTVVHIAGEKLPISLDERTKQVDHVPTPEELQKQRKGLYYWAPRYDHLATGELVFSIDSSQIRQRNWNDGKKQRVETCLGEIAIAMVQAAENERLWRIERELREQRWREEERRRLELQIRRHEEEKRLEALIGEAEDWRLAVSIREYAEALKRRADHTLGAEQRAKLLDYASWAGEKADWLDPLVRKVDPLLGARR